MARQSKNNKRTHQAQSVIRSGRKYPGIPEEETSHVKYDQVKAPQKFLHGDGPTAEIWRMFGVKKQVVQYEPVWAEVGLSLPTKLEHINDADKWARGFIIERLQKELEELSEEE